MQSTNKSLKSEFIFDSEATANALPYRELTRSIENLLSDNNVAVPQRIVLPMAKDSSLFVMPAHDSNIAITKIISVLPYNRDLGLPSVQGIFFKNCGWAGWDLAAARCIAKSIKQ